MQKLLLYFAHPGLKHSHANAQMLHAARSVDGISIVDLYATYPRFHIKADQEQERLRAHDIILFQFPFFWYSTPAIIKEWQDIVLEHGFAYGSGGDALAGKRLGLAITAAGPAEAYTPGGYQHHPIRSFLTPLEQTARLCKMRFLPPYVLYGALQAIEDGRIPAHVAGYKRLLEGLRDGDLDPEAGPDEVWTADTPALAGRG